MTRLKSCYSIPLHGSASALDKSVHHGHPDDDCISNASVSSSSTVSLLAYADPDRRLAAISAEFDLTDHTKVSMRYCCIWHSGDD
ncbi:hypothetical protein NP493_538g05038 [Ridgeia piscesae]|uniref:Uncharacterized protein n=1 Tax=Ridgeia piscesae TaxID=27915 RepID=A0AAD9KXI2_RIDPI|nr:hypothetical protein NP493_538g05038 [Ridgeia piscesae]